MHIAFLFRVLGLVTAVAFLPLSSVSAVQTYGGESVRIADKQKRKTTARERKLAAVRRDLHRNLDGKGDGFIQGWAFNARAFTLKVDKKRYQQDMLFAATMTARAIFETNGVALPTILVIRDISEEVLGEGPFANVPKLVD
jgi:hypothetical protein